jgi:hypothetical protein
VRGFSDEDRANISTEMLDEVAALVNDPNPSVAEDAAVVLGRFGVRAKKYLPQLEAVLDRVVGSQPVLKPYTGRGLDDTLRETIWTIQNSLEPKANSE